MPHALELRFSPSDEAQIRALWQAAARIYDSTYLFDNEVIPHLALLVSNESLEAVFSKFSHPSFLITFTAIERFDESSTIYLEANTSSILLRLHQAAFDDASKSGIDIHSYYHPKLWVPHCTIAHQVHDTKNPLPLDFPTQVTVNSLIHVDFPPTRLISEKPLR